VANRDAHVIISGTRDGSALIAGNGEPQRMFVIADPLMVKQPMLMLGAAHRSCIPQARARLEAGTIKLPEQLPLMLVEPHDGELTRLDVPPVVGSCPFCESTEDITDEDIWARWISKLMRERFGNFRISTANGYKAHQRIPYIAPVCGTCNNRWLSVLEKDVQPTLSSMILGPQPGEPQYRTLTSAQQELLATWAVKTAFMIDFSGIAPPVIPAIYYQQLRMYRQALPNTVVLLAAYKGDQRAIFAAHGGLHLGIEPGMPPNVFMTLFTAGRVVFKIFGYIGSDFPQNVSYNSAFDHGLNRIWPATGDSIDWPRNGMAFNDDALLPFGQEQPVLQGKIASQDS